jgi:hypothetical protein
MRKCKFIKSDGQECRANPMKDSEFCFTHNPDTEEERMYAVSKGGSSPRKAREPLPELKIEDAKDVVRLLSTTITEVRAGSVELRVANCIGYLSGHLIKAFEVSTLEERIIRLEKLLPN